MVSSILTDWTELIVRETALDLCYPHFGSTDVVRQIGEVLLRNEAEGTYGTGQYEIRAWHFSLFRWL